MVSTFLLPEQFKFIHPHVSFCMGGLLFVIRCLIECVSVGFLSCLSLFLFVNVFLVLIHSNLVHKLNKESSLFGF